MEQIQPGPVGPVARSRVTGAAKRTLGNGTVFEARKGTSPVLKFKNNSRRGAGHDFDRILVSQEIRTFDGIIGMPLGSIVFSQRMICKGGVNSTLSRPRV